jgi:sulfate permease, SulP family
VPSSEEALDEPTPRPVRPLELPPEDALALSRSAGASEETNERAPLLAAGGLPSYTSIPTPLPMPPNGLVNAAAPPVRKMPFAARLHRLRAHAAHAASPAALRSTLATSARALPAVMLGALLNVLDGVSYGMIIFPASGVFAAAALGPAGVSMFFVSTLVSQLVYCAGGSGFAGANGSMMIEVVPFFHVLAARIEREIVGGGGAAEEVIATTLVAFALSSVMTGLAFFALGAARLGTLIGFFPRHILVGCIGGVGVFLVITGCVFLLPRSVPRSSPLHLSYSRPYLTCLHGLG